MWGPLVRRPHVLQQPGSVGLHEAHVHLHSAPVRSSGVAPGTFVRVDAESAGNEHLGKRQGMRSGVLAQQQVEGSEGDEGC